MPVFNLKNRYSQHVILAGFIVCLPGNRETPKWGTEHVLNIFRALGANGLDHSVNPLFL